MKPTLTSKYNLDSHIKEARDLVALSLPRITHPEVIEITTQFLLGQLDVTDEEFLHERSIIIIGCGRIGLRTLRLLRTLGFFIKTKYKRDTMSIQVTEYRFMLAKHILTETLNE